MFFAFWCSFPNAYPKLHPPPAAEPLLGRADQRNDGLGNVRQVLSEAGVPSQRAFSDPWGAVVGGALSTPFGFTGERQDAALDLVYLRARWYHAGHGTFTSRDPFQGFPQQPYSLHSYQYAYANPVLWTDPSGWVPACQECVEILYRESIVYHTGELGDYSYSNVEGEPGEYYEVDTKVRLRSSGNGYLYNAQDHTLYQICKRGHGCKYAFSDSDSFTTTKDAIAAVAAARDDLRLTIEAGIGIGITAAVLACLASGAILAPPVCLAQMGIGVAAGVIGGGIAYWINVRQQVTASTQILDVNWKGILNVGRPRLIPRPCP